MINKTNISLGEALVIGQHYAERSAVRHILSSELGLTDSQIHGHPERELDASVWERVLTKLKRAHQGEPLPYILGTAAFFKDAFKVSPDTLIPRPETELLVEAALDFLKKRASPQRVIDVGTGSGCIAISIELYAAPQTKTIATDISLAALQIARDNAGRLGSTVSFCQADLLTPFAQTPPFDLIVANLPYVAHSEKGLMDKHVLAYEPETALFSPDEGRFHIRTLLNQSRSLLAPDGQILLEFGFQQGESMRSIASDLYRNHHIDIIKDWGGHDRILQIGIK